MAASGGLDLLSARRWASGLGAAACDDVAGFGAASVRYRLAEVAREWGSSGGAWRGARQIVDAVTVYSLTL